MKISHLQYDINQNIVLNNVGSFIASTFTSGLWATSAPLLAHHDDSSRYKSLIDAHHEGRFKLITEFLLKNSLDDLEIKALEKIFHFYYDFCVLHNLPFDTNSNSIYSALYQSRIIREIHSPNLSDLVIYEIGPGSGFLSILLILLGANVYSIEGVQSHYCYQSDFFNYCFKSDFTEHANSTTFDLIEINKFNHLPWWKICNPKSILPKADIIVSNHMLMETSQSALDFYRFFAKKILNENSSWIIEGVGAHYNGGPKQSEFFEEVLKMNFNITDYTSIYSHYGVYLISAVNKTSLERIKLGISLQDFILYIKNKYPNKIDNSDNYLSNTEWMNFLKLNPNTGSRIQEF